MPTVYVLNGETSDIERYDRQPGDEMPYAGPHALTVEAFRGDSCSDVLWTERRAMEAWRGTARAFGGPVPVCLAFRRIWEGGRRPMSLHYAGVALDTGPAAPGEASLPGLYEAARGAGAWSHVRQANASPACLHLDTAQGIPACAGGGYPPVRRGDRNTYVFVLQDALGALGYTDGGLDGIFGLRVEIAVRRFQKDAGIWPDGTVGCATWVMLTGAAAGIGRTPTVLGGC